MQADPKIRTGFFHARRRLAIVSTIGSGYRLNTPYFGLVFQGLFLIGLWNPSNLFQVIPSDFFISGLFKKLPVLARSDSKIQD